MPERLAWMQPAAPGVTLVGAADRAEAVRAVADADAVIGECFADVIEAGPRLRWVQRMYAGVERCVTIPAFTERGIVLTNMQKIAGPVMSEHVLALMFGLTRGFATYVPAQARGEWADEAVPESRMWSIEGKTLLVAGLGGIGSEVARRAHALGMNVIATRNTPREKPAYVSEQGLSADLPAFVARADVIVNALPLTPETKGVFDRKIFDADEARRALHQCGPRRHRRDRGPDRGAPGRPDRRRRTRCHRSGAASGRSSAVAGAERDDHAACRGRDRPRRGAALADRARKPAPLRVGRQATVRSGREARLLRAPVSNRTLSLDDRLYEYLLAHSLREPPALAKLRAETASHPKVNMQIAPEQGQFMQMLVRLLGARRAIEVGVFTGYSSLAVMLAMPPDGRLLACDISEEFTAIARRHWQAAGVADRIELVIAPAKATLDARLAAGEAGRYDFAFIDADKTGYLAYYERLIQLVRPGGLIVVDNTLWGGDVADPSNRDADTVALREFNDVLLADTRIELSLLPLGDGLTLARRREAV